MSPLVKFGISVVLALLVCVPIVGYVSRPLSRWRSLWLLPFYALMVGMAVVAVHIEAPYMAWFFAFLCLAFGAVQVLPGILMKRRMRLAAEGRRPAPECPRAPADSMGTHASDPNSVERSYREQQPRFQCRWCEASLSGEHVHAEKLKGWRIFRTLGSGLLLLSGASFGMGLLIDSRKLNWEMPCLMLACGAYFLYMGRLDLRRYEQFVRRVEQP